MTGIEQAFTKWWEEKYLSIDPILARRLRNFDIACAAWNRAHETGFIEGDGYGMERVFQAMEQYLKDETGTCNEVLVFAERVTRKAIDRTKGQYSLNVCDVSEILLDRTEGVLWKSPNDGQISRFTAALNEVLRRKNG